MLQSTPLLFFSILHRHPISTLFPYTTLFRSRAGLVTDHPPIAGFQANAANPHYEPQAGSDRRLAAGDVLRSEEHTSELQSHSDLVCRLLLEKKKKQNRTTRRSTRLPDNGRGK